MAQILWLASFPKSGNTWLRAFLANYLLDQPEPVAINTLPNFVFGDMRAETYEKLSGRRAQEMTREEIQRLRPRVHRFLASTRPGLVLVKTHNILTMIDGVPMITPDVTFGALYVVRNPLDVVISFAHHYALPMERAAQAICFRGLEIPAKQGHIVQIVSDWSSHVKGWLDAPGLYRKVVRYEDLTANPTTEFSAVLDFLKLPRDRKRLKKAVRFSSFRELAGQEDRAGFVERSKGAERFFRKGRVGDWRRVLSQREIDLVVGHHGEWMARLGYLSPQGEVLP